MAFSLFRRKKKEGAGQEKSHFYHRFAQQELAGWSPVITAKVVVIYFFAVACVCVALGVPVLVASLGVVQYTVRYDDQGNDMAGISDQVRTSVDLGFTPVLCIEAAIASRLTCTRCSCPAQ